ncbi:MAG: DUF262 domain-containing protein [Planctomycetaceae bacterium]|nr:DUF262 domain-containing protein [Planctomycetaceae bacterium]
MAKRAHAPTLFTAEEEAEFRAKIARAEEQIVVQSKRIEFYLTEYSVELLAQKMGNQEFEIPPYQREDTWEPERKSRFIESLLMGLAIPFLFFWERPTTGKLEIVDGSQRLRTIQQFLAGELVLGELDVLTELEGLRFTDLPESRQRKIRNRSIRGIVLNENADEQARFDIFDRINTGSKIANKAEVRRGALVGPFLDMVIDLSKDATFIELAPIPPAAVNLREREELVTRFFAYGDGLEGYKDRPADFLFDYAKKMTEHFSQNPGEIARYRERFNRTMQFAKKIFPLGFRKTPRATETPRTRFEALAIGTQLALAARPELFNQTPNVQDWIGSEEFMTLTKSGGANPIASLRGRLEYVRDKLLGA